MHSREQYLEQVREEYRRASKKEKTRLLNEARKRTRLARKVLIRKLAHPAKLKQPKAKRGASYGAEVVTTLVEVWELFDWQQNADHKTTVGVYSLRAFFRKAVRANGERV